MPSLIDRTSPLPLYHQIKERLMEELPEPGQQLPTEQELTARFGVSRMTVVQALKALEQEGVIYRIQGKGTFVSPRKMEQRLAHLRGFTEEMQHRGMRPVSRLLSLERAEPLARVRRELGLDPDEQVWKIVRLRLTGDEPIGLQTVYLPERLCPDLAPEMLTGSLYALLKERYGLVPLRATEAYEASVTSSDYIARLLGVAMGAPILNVVRITWTQGREHPFEYVSSQIRGDRYILHVDLEGSAT